MNTTENQCCICQRFLTEEEVNKAHTAHQPVSNARCYYCICETYAQLNAGSSEPTPPPPPKEYGREELPTVIPEQPLNEIKPKKSKQENWSEKQIKQFKEQFEVDLEKLSEDDSDTIEVKKLKGGGDYVKQTIGGKPRTIIIARGSSEDVSLTLEIPRELYNDKLATSIEKGLSSVLQSIIHMLAFAPLHNGVMRDILNPPPPNPFTPPANGPFD